jgi:flagellar protein FlaG
MNAQRLTSAAFTAPVPAAAAPVAQAAIPLPPIQLPGAAAIQPSQPGQAVQAQAREAFLSAAKELRDAIGNVSQTYAKFHMDPHTHMVSVAIVDQDSGQVVRQIPSEALTRFAESWDAFVGNLLDHEA